jgi:dTDP-4-amino-4,6-dideoxygalactose transaminase
MITHPARSIPLVDLGAQYRAIQPDIDAAIARVLAHTGFIGGDEVKQFEAAFAQFQGTGYCVGVASGTAALFLALKAVGVGPGDEVITTPHTFIATAEPIETLGAKTVMVDIDPRTYNLDPAALEAAITPKTKAIVPVHLYGQLADMDAIGAIADAHGIAVIEDAAQAHAAERGGRRAGSWGRAACFSFYPGKNLGAYGDAGAVCTHDPALAAQVAKWRDHGRTSKYAHDEIGWGERLDALQAAILGAKLPHLARWTDARRRIAAVYDRLLADVPGVHVPYADPAGRPAYHIYALVLDSTPDEQPDSPARRDAVLKALQARGVGAGVHYPIPLHLQGAFAGHGYARGAFPVSERIAAREISLPIYPEMTDDDAAWVAEQVRMVVMEA